MSISMDADLQDDMDAMDRFIEKYREGCDVVYGVRNRRDTDTAFKRGTALMFYRLMKALGVDITYNHADLPPHERAGAGGRFRSLARSICSCAGWRPWSAFKAMW